MRKGRIAAAVVSAAVVAAGLLTAAALSTPAVGATAGGTCVSSGKCYLTVVTPSSVVAGVSQDFTVTVTNEATTQTLGSVQVTAPGGFVITGATGGTASYTAAAAQFLYLGLAPGHQATLTLDATAPCGGGTSAWGIVAKQSNQFNGSGNDFIIDPQSSLAATVSGSCKLAFFGQPQDTMVGKTITTKVGSSGGPVAVEVLDGANNLLATSTAQVQIVLNSGPGTLSGTTTVAAIGGVADFKDLSINTPGVNDTLEAESTGISSATSSPFTIWPFLQGCNGTCSGSSSSKTTTGTVTTSATGEFLGVGVGGSTYSCASPYQPLSDPLGFDVLSPSGTTDSGASFTSTLEIAKSVVQSSGHPGASSWQICYASPQPFAVQPGTGGQATIDGVVYNTGLLPDCSSTQQKAPCVKARTKDNAGDVLITFLAAGDPHARA
jgi:hypothetical protein